MKLFYWSVGGLMALVGAVFAIATFWPEPYNRIVAVSLVSEDWPTATTLCYRLSKYEFMGRRWGEAQTLPVIERPLSDGTPFQDCEGTEENFIFDCMGEDETICQELVEFILVKRPIVTTEELLKQQKSGPR